MRQSLIGDVLDTRFGHAWLLRAALAVLLASVAMIAARRTERGHASLAAVALGLGVLIAATPAVSGHARVVGGVALASDWVHVVAASVWAGGLVFLLIALWRAQSEERWQFTARAVPRFSVLAVVSIATLLTAGVVNGFLEVGSWRGLWETTYGQLLLVKVALVLPVLALGAFDDRVSVPRLRAKIASALERRRFLMFVAVSSRSLSSSSAFRRHSSPSRRRRRNPPPRPLRSHVTYSCVCTRPTRKLHRRGPRSDNERRSTDTAACTG